MVMTGSAGTTSAFDSDSIGALRDPGIVDNWSFLDYKKSFSNALGTLAKWIPSWVGDHRRRLRAYLMLESYYRQTARRLVVETENSENTDDRREYGDAYVIVETTLASLLGNDQNIVVEGAISGEENSKNKQQERLQEWAEDENFLLHLSECERNAVKLGDGVYTLGWNSKKKRPVLRVWDPGFYFPVDDPLNDEEFPKTVHIAYEFENEVGGSKKRFVRKITWWMMPATSSTVLPWNDEASEETCWFSDGIWELKGSQRQGLDELGDGAAQWRTEPQDLGIDFIPVIHIPNMNFNSTELWGTSVITPVLQLLDDLHVNDTDLADAARLTAWPLIGIEDGHLERDASGRVLNYGPGTTIEGRLNIPDTSRNLDALLKFEEKRLGRLAVNSRVPETILGRVDPGKVQSGVILTITLAPHTTLIREMRRIRKNKYRLLFKFVLRFLWKENASEFSEIFNTDLQMGSYLPADKQEVAGIVTGVLNAHGISRETAVRMLVDAGYPVDDISAEIDRIQSIDFDGAAKIVDATGDFDAAREYLGIAGSTPQGVSEEDKLQHEEDMQQSQQDFGREQFLAQQKLSNDQAKERQPSGPPQR